ncbi:MAG: hypothetical protein ACRETE_06580, partial [Stenotrophobium sp.]
SFAGLNGIVIKSHGSADALSFANAIRVAVLEVERDVPARISKLLEVALAKPPCAAGLAPPCTGSEKASVA